MKEDAQSTPSSSYATNMADTEIAKAVNEIGFWWHSLDLHGFITPGGKSQQVLHNEWRAMDVPDLRGKSVLDIGAWDGFFSPDSPQSSAMKIARHAQNRLRVRPASIFARVRRGQHLAQTKPAIETPGCLRQARERAASPLGVVANHVTTG